MAILKNGECVKIEGVMGSKAQVRCVVSFTKDDKRVGEKEYFYVPNMNGSNFIKQAYEYIKTLPEFEGATDC
jgi:hypothetical protein